MSEVEVVSDVERVGSRQWRLVTRQDLGDVTATTTTWWFHKPTPDEIAAALEGLGAVNARPGESVYGRRHGPFTFWKEDGGPPWPRPKVVLRWGHLAIGWRMTAWARAVDEWERARRRLKVKSA